MLRRSRVSRPPLASLGVLLLTLSPAAQAQRCGDVITQSTVLRQDVICPSTFQPGLTVRGDGVVLDLGGHTISMAPGFATAAGVHAPPGVLVEGSASVVVTNGHIINRGKFPGFQGIRFQASERGTASALTIQGLGQGVVLVDSPAAAIIENALLVTWGIQFLSPSPTQPPVVGSPATRIVGNRMDGGGAADGRFVDVYDRSSDVVVEGNVARRLVSGILAPNVRGIQVLRNHLSGCSGIGCYGVLVYDALGGIVEGNLIEGFNTAIAVSSQDALVQANELYGGGAAGPAIAIGGVFNMFAPSTAFARSLIKGNVAFDYVVGLRFHARAQSNDGRGNTWVQVPVPVENFGRGNRW